MIGNSAKMQEVYQLIDASAKNNIVVLIQGETGTGKELVAQAIHKRSNRCKFPFVPINCAAIPHELAESELFGHEKGAFTSAIKDRAGKLELAHTGTILFDEIGEMDILLQSKLLRVVEDKSVYRIGASKAVNIDIRIIAATNKPLSKHVQNGKFRDDLFYRLSVFQINLPPLRERKEDIPDLVNHFINMANKEFNEDVKGVDKKALNKLMEYDWPGNVRQLGNCINRAVVMTNNAYIAMEDITIQESMIRESTIRESSLSTSLENEPILKTREHAPVFLYSKNDKREDSSSLIDLELMAIKRMLQEKNGNKKETAKALGIGRSSLYWKIKRHDLV